MIDYKKLIMQLNNDKVEYKEFFHPPLNTVEVSQKLRGNIKGGHTKNLFIKNKKNKFFLFTCHEKRRVDLKILRKNLSLGNISFASEIYLLNYLGVMPGAVTPFGLLNDINNKIDYYLDEKLIHYKSLNFHPLINTVTVNINTNDFLKILKTNKKLVNILNFDNYSII